MTVTLPKIYGDILESSNHILIAGATGSGKSVTLHGFISWILTENADIAFIDLKRVEMIRYKKIAVAYANTAPAALQLLQSVRDVMMKRYKKMEKKRVEEWDGKPLYIIIDEWAELYIDSKKQAAPLVQSIAQLGRACKVFLIMATQAPLASIIPTPIKLNFNTLLALRTRSAQDSRNIINCSGAEKLPAYGKGILVMPKLLKPLTVDLPRVDKSTTQALIRNR